VGHRNFLINNPEISTSVGGGSVVPENSVVEFKMRKKGK
jgi:hypothetical protein